MAKGDSLLRQRQPHRYKTLVTPHLSPLISWIPTSTTMRNKQNNSLAVKKNPTLFPLNRDLTLLSKGRPQSRSRIRSQLLRRVRRFDGLSRVSKPGSRCRRCRACGLATHRRNFQVDCISWPSSSLWSWHGYHCRHHRQRHHPDRRIQYPFHESKMGPRYPEVGRGEDLDRTRVCSFHQSSQVRALQASPL